MLDPIGPPTTYCLMVELQSKPGDDPMVHPAGLWVWVVELLVERDRDYGEFEYEYSWDDRDAHLFDNRFEAIDAALLLRSEGIQSRLMAKLPLFNVNGAVQLNDPADKPKPPIKGDAD